MTQTTRTIRRRKQQNKDNLIDRITFHADQIESRIAELQKRVAEHRNEIKDGTANWATVGDLAHWNELLGQALGIED